MRSVGTLLVSVLALSGIYAACNFSTEDDILGGAPVGATAGLILGALLVLFQRFPHAPGRSEPVPGAGR